MPNSVNQGINQFNVYGVNQCYTHLFTTVDQQQVVNEAVNIFTLGGKQHRHLNKDG
jgi:hypothetical protein